jgi:hypothetical protein
MRLRGGMAATTRVFLNGHNWQTVPMIALPLRRLGVAAAMILDLDALTKDDKWAEVFANIGFGSAQERDEFARRRAQVRDCLISPGRTVTDPRSPLKVKAQGVDAVSEQDRPVVDTFLVDLHRYGIFVVAVGQLENWLPSLGVRKSPTWLAEILRRLGTQGSSTYITPGSGDVWAFMEAVAAWTDDPGRAGVP